MLPRALEESVCGWSKSTEDVNTTFATKEITNTLWQEILQVLGDVTFGDNDGISCVSNDSRTG